jgi:transcriptional regulator with XRE-family HTH domain
MKSRPRGTVAEEPQGHKVSVSPVTRPSLPTATVGQLLRHHRLERHLTQTELARQIGIQQSDLSRMEKGEYRVSLDVLFRILQVFELSLGQFFGDLAEQQLTSRESVMVESFRALSREDQDEVVQFVEFKRSRTHEREE